MEYSTATPQPSKTMKPHNPLFGNSEYEPRRQAFQQEYKEFCRKSLETSREKSQSKRQVKFIEKLQESEHKSPNNQELNIYAMKQRYKYSSHLTGSQTNLHEGMRDHSGGQENTEATQNRPAYATLLGQTKNLEDPQTGYILKTDPLQVLID